MEQKLMELKAQVFDQAKKIGQLQAALNKMATPYVEEIKRMEKEVEVLNKQIEELENDAKKSEIA